MSNRVMKVAVMMVSVIIILAVLAVVFFPKNKSQLPKPIAINTDNQPTLGNPNAPLKFVIFEDLKCFNCARYEVNLFPKIKQKYIDTGKAQYTLINVAFIDGSLPAANAARCVYKQNKELFFPFIEHLYKHQPPEERDWATIPNLMRFAGQVPGIDLKQLSECLVQSPYTDLLANNLQIASKIMNGTVATPSLYINGIKVEPLNISRVDEVVEAVSKNK